MIALCVRTRLFSCKKEFLVTKILLRAAAQLWKDEKDETTGYEEATCQVRAKLAAWMKTKFGKDVEKGNCNQQRVAGNQQRAEIKSICAGFYVAFCQSEI